MQRTRVPLQRAAIALTVVVGLQAQCIRPALGADPNHVAATPDTAPEPRAAPEGSDGFVPRERKLYRAGMGLTIGGGVVLGIGAIILLLQAASINGCRPAKEGSNCKPLTPKGTGAGVAATGGALLLSGAIMMPVATSQRNARQARRQKLSVGATGLTLRF